MAERVGVAPARRVCGGERGVAPARRVCSTEGRIAPSRRIRRSGRRRGEHASHRPSVRLSIRPSARLSIRPSVRPPTRPSIHPSIHPSFPPLQNRRSGGGRVLRRESSCVRQIRRFSVVWGGVRASNKHPPPSSRTGDLARAGCCGENPPASATSGDFARFRRTGAETGPRARAQSGTCLPPSPEQEIWRRQGGVAETILCPPDQEIAIPGWWRGSAEGSRSVSTPLAARRGLGMVGCRNESVLAENGLIAAPERNLA